MWLDDIREPWRFGCVGWRWAKSADEAIEVLRRGNVVEASLDHDLDIYATIGEPPRERTGYDVVCWMEANDVWPRDGVRVHSMNPAGAARMRQVIERAYARDRSPDSLPANPRPPAARGTPNPGETTHGE